jgi:hypothetical protein
MKLKLFLAVVALSSFALRSMAGDVPQALVLERAEWAWEAAWGMAVRWAPVWARTWAGA